ncbi:substrate-binding domain-containing protein [Dyadobacter arcticus]|uniref:Ribose/xylose/arabinose/galactoside ABC-type transport system permease subunit/ABC-type sugar transport system substrate-binding protein n=1 Tax=Dyadobacter arcticus TaxID=1078754 RepID=A0ABX0ULS2_9BACT|nr:substrate-binding domain-containing protein [Dyadobacter arcticus]NIJ53862.1 ribose/xylose/arabinose/galactoside ABC-type transport system permease subunit/ABC-type sugar transport system substrate-binding protein [Dyadobacter arcticus]
MKKIFSERIYTLTLTIGVIAVAASIIYPDQFPTFQNFSQIFLNLSIDTIVAVGMMLLMISGAFDLSVGSVVAFSSCLAAYLMFFMHVPVPVALLISLLASLSIGGINGYLIAYQGINPMIQTLAMMGIVRGLALLVSGAGIQGLPYWFNAISQSRLLGIQMPIWYMLLIVIAVAFLTRNTTFLKRYYFIGGNDKAAELSGINVKKMRLFSFMLISLLAGFAGILLASRLGAALPTSGRNLELRVITAVILGGASLQGGTGKIQGALLGAILMGLIANIMIIARVSGYWQEIILGIILILAVWIDRILQRGNFGGNVKKWTALFLLSLTVMSCELPPREENASSEKIAFDTTQTFENEEYVMVTTAVSMPMYVNHDQAAFIRWGKANHVKVSILGPSDWDVPAQINTIEEVIGTRPTGLLINGTDPAIAGAINKAVDAGIPTVVYDSDIPNSKRHAFLGTNWYEIGQMQGNEMVKLTSGKGKIAYMGILGLSNMEDGFRGLLDVFKKYPGIEVVGKYDDKANVEEAAKITADLISAHPDLAGLCGFDSNSGPGIALSVKEAGKAGKIKITTVDWEPEHLNLVNEGIIQLLAGQKRELFTWYGAQFLYDMVHKTNKLSTNDSKAGITNLPTTVNTGLIKITKENVGQFLKK